MTKLLILDDSQVAAMLRNHDIVNRFPFMRAMAEQLRNAGKRGSCGSCSKPAAGQSQTLDYSGVRAAIDSLGKSDQDQLKRMLKADRIRLYYKDHRGKTTKSTI